MVSAKHCSDKLHRPNIAIQLQARETGGLSTAVFTKIPPRLHLFIENILDEERAVLGCVLLGFTRSGSYLVSYTNSPVTASDGAEGYHLQLWAFRVAGRLKRVANIPLFRLNNCGIMATGASQIGGDDEVQLTLCEAADDSAIVVHGRLSFELGYEELVNHVTVIAAPCLGYHTLQVVHLTYTTVSPHPTFNAATLASPSTLLLNCSTSVLALYMSLDATCGREALARCQRAQQAFGVGTTHRTVSNGEQHNGDSPTCSSLEDRSSVDSEGGADFMSAVSLRSTRSTCAVTCSWRGADSSACFKQLTCHQLFDVEQFLQTALTSEMADGERLFDYDMQIVSAVAPALGLRTWPCGCATRQQPPPPRNHIAVSCTDPTAIVVIGAALQPTTRRAGHADVSTTNRDPSEQRLLALVVSLNLASSVSRLLRKQQVTVSPTHAQRPRLVVDVAKHFAELLRREGAWL